MFIIILIIIMAFGNVSAFLDVIGDLHDILQLIYIQLTNIRLTNILLTYY